MNNFPSSEALSGLFSGRLPILSGSKSSTQQSQQQSKNIELIDLVDDDDTDKDCSQEVENRSELLNQESSFLSRMQPTLPQSTGAADMDSLPAVQSMDWLFKKERIYLLAQFWQQVSS
jgi:hypothetical protein